MVVDFSVCGILGFILVIICFVLLNIVGVKLEEIFDEYFLFLLGGDKWRSVRFVGGLLVILW